MLSSLHIRHYVLIDSLDIEFPEGLVIITGQTGAGKSILLGALALALGGKAEASVISEGADSCVVEAEFELDPSLRGFLEENDVEWDSGHLTVRRVVHSSARSRSFVNDVPVSQQFLSELSAHLVDIHSQHQSLLLKDRSWQLSLLDHYCGNADLLRDCALCWGEMQKLQAELQAREQQLEKLSSGKEYNTARYRQLVDAHLRAGELEELEEEHKALAHAEDIKASLCTVSSLCNGGESAGLGGILRQSEKALLKAAAYIPELDSLARRMESARIELEDILGEIEDRNESISLSEDRLQTVEQRLSLLYDLMGRFSASTVGELIEMREQLSLDVEGTDVLEEQIAGLRSELEAKRAAHARICEKLSQSRAASAGKFASEIQQMLRFLELDRAVFEVQLSEAAPSARGAQSVSYLFSSNGTRPEDVAKCASGGEISRIMLCMKALMARFTAMPTMIFDEIDTGVSGSVADKMGSMICDMGRDMQVFAITHLPQVAAKGDAHLVVSKQETEGRTLTTIARVEGEQRVNEIARLLSGATVSAEAVANARVLLSGKI